MRKGRKRLDSLLSPHAIGFVVLLAGGIVLVGGHIIEHGWRLNDPVGELYGNVGAELLGIAITVLLIDALNEQREQRRLKEQLIREMGGSDNGLAIRAAREMEARGWLRDGSLVGANLAGADLRHVQLEGADCRKINLAGAQLCNANLARTMLVGANLTGADLSRANLEMTDAKESSLQEANLGEADMAFAMLHNADLAGAYLVRADLTQTDLTGADLRGVDFSEARLRRANASRARHDETTTWPSNISLEEIGLISID